MIDISIIIVTYNSAGFIGKCINSLLNNEKSRYEIIVFDNSSADSTAEELKTFGSKINSILSDKNLGFAKANNLAAKSAKGEFLFFLNPDTEIKRPILEEMVDFYEKNQDVGLIAPKLILPNGNPQPSVKKLPSIAGAFKEYILGIKNAYSEYIPSEKFPVEIESAYGAALLIKSDLFKKLGGFDERYFLYYEDLDLSRKLKRVGKKIFYMPNASLMHTVGASKSDEDRQKLNMKSAIIYHGLINVLILRAIFFFSRLFKKLHLK